MSIDNATVDEWTDSSLQFYADMRDKKMQEMKNANEQFWSSAVAKQTSGAYSDDLRAPEHYKWFDEEVIDVIARVLTEEELMGYIKGNSLKYRLRAGKKDSTEKDIGKAMEYEGRIYHEQQW